MADIELDTPRPAPAHPREAVASWPPPPPSIADRSTTSANSARLALIPVQLFIGLGWLRAAVEKAIDRRWWRGEVIGDFLDDHRSESLPFVQPLVDRVDAPIAQTIAVAVIVAQLLVALGFASTRTLRPALWLGLTMNVAFVALGAVSPSAFYLVIQVALLAGLRHGAFGLDRRPARPASIWPKVLVVAAMVPFVGTLHPAEVIDDPAIMLATVAAIAAVTDVAARRFVEPAVA